MVNKNIIKPNREGQVHSIEIVICGILIVSAIAFVSYRPLPSQKTLTQQRLYEIGYTSLDSLDKTPNSSGKSTLAEYIYKKNVSALTKYLNKTLPTGVLYSIYVSIPTKEVQWYVVEIPSGDVMVVVHKVILLSDPPPDFKGYIGFTYDVRLVMWLG